MMIEPTSSPTQAISLTCVSKGDRNRVAVWAVKSKCTYPHAVMSQMIVLRRFSRLMYTGVTYDGDYMTSRPTNRLAC